METCETNQRIVDLTWNGVAYCQDGNRSRVVTLYLFTYLSYFSVFDSANGTRSGPDRVRSNGSGPGHPGKLVMMPLSVCSVLLESCLWLRLKQTLNRIPAPIS
jgi:hypothetical protein